MGVVLLNLQSNQKIELNSDTPVIIGRGNVKGCFDKRVSRNHVKITCTVNGKIHLLALHCNPCFFTRNGVPPVHQIKKDEEATLNEGDYLGLLPNTFWFKVTSDVDSKIKNQSDCKSSRTDVNSDEINQNINLSENCKTLFSSSKEIINCEKSECATSSKPEKNNSDSLTVSILSKDSYSLNSSKVFGTPEFEKTRRLPLWMYEIDDPVESSKDKNKNKHSLKIETEIQEKKQKILPEIHTKEIETKPKEEIKVEDRTTQNLDTPSTSKDKNVRTSNLTYKSDIVEEATKNRNEKEGNESTCDSEESLGPKRPICLYEGNCYRKNPQHKLEFSHPGDADYVQYEDRPFCQYGAACYRKNEIHKTNFRHSSPGSSPLSHMSPSSSIASSPLPAKRRRKIVNKQSSEYYEDGDEYELEDPFTNDASSDEFIPSGLESEDEDDLNASQNNDF